MCVCGIFFSLSYVLCAALASKPVIFAHNINFVLFVPGSGTYLRQGETRTNLFTEWVSEKLEANYTSKQSEISPFLMSLIENSMCFTTFDSLLFGHIKLLEKIGHYNEKKEKINKEISLSSRNLLNKRYKNLVTV